MNIKRIKREGWKYYTIYGPDEMVEELKEYQRAWKLANLDKWTEYQKEKLRQQINK
ncbi:MAG: hypothetical protein U1G07_05835 [Verrucomicrobiota bacterium]